MLVDEKRTYHHFSCCCALWVTGNILMNRCFGGLSQKRLTSTYCSKDWVSLFCSFQVVQSWHPLALSASQDGHVLNFMFHGQGSTWEFGLWRQLLPVIACCQDVLTSWVSVSHFLLTVRLAMAFCSMFFLHENHLLVSSYLKNIFCMQVPQIANVSPTPTFLRKYSLSSHVCWAVVFGRVGTYYCNHREGDGIRYILSIASIISVWCADL